ncbi:MULTISPECIES: hypothetical protein [unclassified Halomonas]|uniref:hypothetical protein n=1 Tax=unclassified Halomonas TaxID=2609666 RepID=UPI001C95DA56|nr:MULTISPECIES: hypothetical protein [unclassified Halomonas]MBY5924269.1 hypothetical protein [Halomonas sp. DP4Y7-2]MBY6231311.1 hypothetical protein [Halomonas sp. DP4Y7-1]
MGKSKSLKFEKISPSCSFNASLDAAKKHYRAKGFDALLDGVLRNESLVVKDGDSDKLSWVENFLNELDGFLCEEAGEFCSGVFISRAEMLRLANRYFLKLKEWRYQTEAAKEMSVEEIVSSSLVRGGEDYLEITRRAREEVLKGRTEDGFLDTQRSYLIEDSVGNRVDPDAAIWTVLESVFLVLKSTGHLEKKLVGECFDFGDFVYPGEDALFKIGALNLNAMAWKRFDDIQKDIRHCEREWVYSPDNRNVPDEHKDKIDEHLDVCAPYNWRKYEVIARNRLRQLTKEIYYGAFEFFRNNNVSLSEYEIGVLSTKLVIERVLSLTVDDERNKCLGLTLRQWLDGYAALQDFAKDSFVDGDSKSLFPMLKKSELLDVFSKKGMLKGVAETFLNNVLFGKGAIDLYDTPVIKFGDNYLVYVPSLKDAILHELVLSNVTRNKERLSRKGDALEEKLFSIFYKMGLGPKKIKERRKGETYEYDVVVKWGDKVFVFECKNRSVANDPILSRNMRDDFVEHQEQVARLCGALKKYPDILEKHFGSGSYEQEIIPCVVNGMPFALDEPLGNTYVIDMPAIIRFFNGRSVDVNYPAGDVEVYTQWSSSKPSVEDFLFFLSTPYQVELGKRYLSSQIEVFPVSLEKIMVRTEDISYEEVGSGDMVEFFAELSEYRKAVLG